MQGLVLRTEIDRLMASGESQAAFSALRELWRQESGTSCATFVVSRGEKLSSRLGMTVHRVAIARSSTVEPLVPLLRAAAFCEGLHLEVYVGEFNAYAQEILDAESALYRFAPQTVILMVEARDCAPDLCLFFAQVRKIPP